MAIHIQSEEVDRLVRDFARRRRMGITEAIKVAIREADEREARNFEECKHRIEPIVERMRACREKGSFEEAIKFIDENWSD